jgi:Bacterial pre-peptidase C-terminal domain/FG-GAP repeat
MRGLSDSFTSAKAVRVPFISLSQKPSVLRDSLSEDNKTKVYKFSLRSSQVFDLSLTNLRGNADIKLFDRQGKLKSDSKKPGKSSEFINELLKPGTYYIQVERKGGEASYKLALSASYGGVHVASSDVNGDGVLDIVTGAGAGSQSSVRVLSGWDGSELHNFVVV